MGRLFKGIIFGLAMIVCAASAQTGPSTDTKRPVRQLYADAATLQYAVEWQANSETLASAQTRINRFWYLVLYADARQFASGQGARLRFGFFKNQQEAERFAEEFESVFGQMKVVAVAGGEGGRVMAMRPDGVAEPFVWLSPEDPVTIASQKWLLDQAKNAFTSGDHDKALAIYGALSLSPDPHTSHWARELTGVVHERKGEPERAAAVYGQLLKDAPDSPAVPRVAQRLRALETAADTGHDALRKPTGLTRKNPSYRGLFGQAYRYLSVEPDGGEKTDKLSVITTNFDLSGRYTTGDHEFGARAYGHHVYHELELPKTPYRDQVEWYLKRLQLDYRHHGLGLEAHAGRLRDHKTGVFTSFDGLAVKYDIGEKITVGAAVGEPVWFYDVYEDLDREFASLMASYDWSEQLKFSGYYIRQTVFDEIDREALGAEVRYLHGNLSAYLNIDYDIEFEAYNNILTGGTYRFKDNSTLALSYGRQRTPFMSAVNVLVGQPELDLENYLRLQYNRDALQYDAFQRTSLSEFGSAVYTRRLGENLDATVDYYQSLLTNVPYFILSEDGFTNVLYTNEAEYFYRAGGVQVTATDFLGMDDTLTIGLRLADSSASTTHWLNLAERLRFFDNRLYITPKLQFGYTGWKNSERSQARIRGSVMAAWRPWRNSELFLELGDELFTDLDAKHDVNSQWLYAGYTLRF